jgi:hypothetical protein
MIGDIPTITFDTSAHNRLVEDGALSEPVLAGLRSGLFFRFAGSSIEELVSCADAAKRDRHTGEKLRAGRNDLFMSVYLPYCDKFVSAEKNREQERCLREVALVAGLETEVLSYDDFCDSFLATA